MKILASQIYDKIFYFANKFVSFILFYYICDINIIVMALLGHILGIIIVIYGFLVVVAMFRYARKFDPDAPLFEIEITFGDKKKSESEKETKTGGD